MSKHLVSLVRYEEPEKSVRRAIELCQGLKNLPRRAKVFIKPNVVFWTKQINWPKWGVITTSRVVEDVVRLLAEHGVAEMALGEGIITFKPKDKLTVAHAFEQLGYNQLKAKYGLKVYDLFERPFRKVDLGGLKLNISAEALDCDFLVNLPVLKTHAQTVVSLGIKNLKGLLDIPSRQRCHNLDPVNHLHAIIARLADPLPKGLTLIDGIFTLERGPIFNGQARRSNLLIASSDTLSADLVGAAALGHSPDRVPHLVQAARNHNRPADLSSVELKGENLQEVASPHQHAFAFNQTGTLSQLMESLGIQGLAYRRFDDTLCTYCSIFNGMVMAMIAKAWQERPWPGVEILNGKAMQASPGYAKTILLGKCAYLANRKNPNIKEMIAIKGCPPEPLEVAEALLKAGVMVDKAAFANVEALPHLAQDRYAGQPGFDPAFFTLSGKKVDQPREAC